jgi:phage-related protein
MANEIAIKFGTFELSSTNGINVSVWDPSEELDFQLTKVPMSEHSISETAKKKSISIDVEGSIVGTDYDDLRSKIDAFKAALVGKQMLTLDDDRYIMAQKSAFGCPFSTLRTIAKWKLTFKAEDPFYYSQTLHEDSRTPTSGSGYTIVNAGNAPTRVKIEVTAPAGGIADACKIENQTNGESFQYRGTIAATKILEVDNRVDANDFSVLNDGVDDTKNFEGDFITLDPGNNTIIYTGTAGATVKLGHRDCWY